MLAVEKQASLVAQSRKGKENPCMKSSNMVLSLTWSSQILKALDLQAQCSSALN